MRRITAFTLSQARISSSRSKNSIEQVDPRRLRTTRPYRSFLWLLPLLPLILFLFLCSFFLAFSSPIFLQPATKRLAAVSKYHATLTNAPPEKTLATLFRVVAAQWIDSLSFFISRHVIPPLFFVLSLSYVHPRAAKLQPFSKRLDDTNRLLRHWKDYFRVRIIWNRKSSVETSSRCSYRHFVSGNLRESRDWERGRKRKKGEREEAESSNAAELRRGPAREQSLR